MQQRTLSRWITAALGGSFAVLALVTCRRAETAPAANAVGQAAVTTTQDPRADAALTVWRASIDSLDGAMTVLAQRLHDMSDGATVEAARAAFTVARTHFKHAEVGLEYYAPSTTRELNGPAQPEVEEMEGPEFIVPPTGFQVVEDGLFGDDALAARETLRQEAQTMQAIVRRARTMLGVQQTTAEHVWDAARMELARIATLGVAGYDSPIADRALPEANDALEGVARSIAPWCSTDAACTHWQRLLDSTRATLAGAGSRSAFNHLRFLSTQLIPLAHRLQSLRTARAIGLPRERRAFRMTAASPYDRGAFDANAFAHAPEDAVPPSRVTLGALLFSDTRLSGDGARSCVSCHDPARAFTDGRRVNAARDGTPLRRNTPTILNAGLQVGSFADLRTTYLEDQVTEVVENEAEMHGRLPEAAARLASDTAMAAAFRQSFSAQASFDSVVTPLRIREALAAYVRSLSFLDAPMDRALRGDTTALTAAQRRGFNLFVGKARCASCHFLPLTNGTVPPHYQKSEVEVIGVPTRAATRGATIDPDLGRFRVTRSAPHAHAFRTPSLRNVARTAPYMHNGVFRTLAEVVDFYERGGGSGIGVALDNQTLPPDRLNLSVAEQRDLVAFLGALTDEGPRVPRARTASAKLR